MHRLGPTLLALLAAAATACGSDRAERDQHARAQAACATVVGMTLAEATAAVGLESPRLAQACLASGSPVGAGDACPGAPGPYTETVCEAGLEWCAVGTSLCSGGPLGGCAYACVLRLLAADRDAVQPSSVVCASTFVTGQPLGPVSGRACR